MTEFQPDGKRSNNLKTTGISMLTTGKTNMAITTGSTHRRTNSEERRREEMMDILLADESSCGAFMHDLINIADLRDAWASMKVRLASVEEALADIKGTLNREVLERDFVLRQQFEMLEKDHNIRLLDHDGRVKRLEVGAIETERTFARHRNQLDGHERRLDASEEILQETRAHLDSVEEQDEDHHRTVLDQFHAIKQEREQHDAHIKKQFSAVADRQTVEEKTRQAVEEEVARINDFLTSEGLYDHITRVCKTILEDYVPWSAMDAEVCRAARELLKPIKQQIRFMAIRHYASNLHMQKRHENNKAEIQRLDDTIEAHAQEHTNIWEAVGIRSTIDMLKTTEASVMRLIEQGAREAESLGIGTSIKMQEVVQRLTEFQNILEDHEHALHHQAEEILNRATKYDIVLNSERIEMCAPKDKFEAEMKEAGAQMKWLMKRVDDLTYAGNFGNRSRMMTADPTPEGGSRAMSRTGTSENLAEDGGFTSWPSMRSLDDRVIMADMQSGSGEQQLLRQQLECLTEAAVMFAHLMLKSQAATREKREQMTEETLFSLSSTLHWVVYRRFPPEFDPMRLRSLALACGISMQGSARRSALQPAPAMSERVGSGMGHSAEDSRKLAGLELPAVHQAKRDAAVDHSSNKPPSASNSPLAASEDASAVGLRQESSAARLPIKAKHKAVRRLSSLQNSLTMVSKPAPTSTQRPAAVFNAKRPIGRGLRPVKQLTVADNSENKHNPQELLRVDSSKMIGSSSEL